MSLVTVVTSVQQLNLVLHVTRLPQELQFLCLEADEVCGKLCGSPERTFKLQPQFLLHQQDMGILFRDELNVT